MIRLNYIQTPSSVLERFGAIRNKGVSRHLISCFQHQTCQCKMNRYVKCVENGKYWAIPEISIVFFGPASDH